MNKILMVVVAMALVIGSQSACKVHKGAATKSAKKDSSASVTKAPPLNSDKKILVDKISHLLSKEITYNTFNGKAKMHYDGPDQKQDFTANVRIKKDKIIWISVTALGGIVQVARIYVTPDSFKMLNYLDKQYKVMAISEVAKILPVPVDFSILQNMIVGNVLKKTGAATDATDFGGSWTIQLEDENYIQQIAYNKTDSTIRSEQIRLKKKDGLQGMIQYGEYVNIDGRQVSATKTINLINAGQQHFLDMSFTKVDFDQVLDYPFSIPKNYKTQ